MSYSEIETKVTSTCPSGHKVRGSIGFVGKTVRCPKCREKFAFGSDFTPKPNERDSSSVSDTGVMKILGDWHATPDLSDREQVATKTCSRCGVSIPETSAVCFHCNCYVGAMPNFMKQITENKTQDR